MSTVVRHSTALLPYLISLFHVASHADSEARTYLVTEAGCPTSRSFLARCGIPLQLPSDSDHPMRSVINVGRIPHLAKNERDMAFRPRTSRRHECRMTALGAWLTRRNRDQFEGQVCRLTAPEHFINSTIDGLMFGLYRLLDRVPTLVQTHCPLWTG